MSAVTGTNFYIEKPRDEHWNTGYDYCIIEAIPSAEQSNKFATEYLKVIKPEDFKYKWDEIEKSRWIVCSGPARQLNINEYVNLIHSLMPERPLPEGWKKGFFSVYRPQDGYCILL